MNSRIHPFDQRIVDASKPFGEAMVAAAARITNDDLLQQALAIRASHSELDRSHHYGYEQEVKELFVSNGIAFDETSREFAAMLGYINIKAEDPQFIPTMDGFNQRVLEASKAYRSAITGGAPDNFSPAKDRLRSAIVAGQFDTGPASVIITQAHIARSAVGSSGVGSPG